MGTRHLTKVYDDDGKHVLLCMYGQFDGYPTGYGKRLAAFVASKRLVNGLPMPADGLANGMQCLAAQIVAHFKDQPGNFYIYPPKTPTGGAGDEYVYRVRPDRISCYAVWPRKLLYKGPAADFAAWSDKHGEG